MKVFPSEFEAMLSPEGRKLLAGDHPAVGVLSRENFYASDALVDHTHLPKYTQVIHDTFEELLVPMVRPLPSAKASYASNADLLPKVGKMRGVPTSTGTDSKAFQRAEELGLVAMLYSESYVKFCTLLAGRAVEGPSLLQLFAYAHGDYAGPHTDNHPDHPRQKEGYCDVHLTFCTPGIREQSIVYEQGGHFSQQRSIAGTGTITAYRLPTWHYTTPLRADSPEDRRWLVLSSFYDAE